MLKENNERGVRMMFLSLEQLQKLKLNPTRADYEIAYETEVKEQEGTALNVSEIMEGLYERLNRPDRPNRKTMPPMLLIIPDPHAVFRCFMRSTTLSSQPGLPGSDYFPFSEFSFPAFKTSSPVPAKEIFLNPTESQKNNSLPSI